MATESRKGQEAERLVFAAEADGNGRDRSSFTWRDRVRVKAALPILSVCRCLWVSAGGECLVKCKQNSSRLCATEKLFAYDSAVLVLGAPR